jgi:serine/threonine-protein kinase
MATSILTIGSRVAEYQVISALGQGGMGAVYRAHDTKLNRDVALKVLLPEVADNPERLARFRREAQILALLNHPNIAHIYGLEEADGVVALVMELVEGPTLADRIAKGPIPLDEALPIAKQIAEGLEAAHEQGIIHRDLKPANIKIRDDGTTKILDFGLARALEPTAATLPSVSLSPTITSPAMTQAGILLGTAAYMAPEQARGKAVDKRVDIWAFGCVVFEMITAKRAFDGEEITDALAFVITREPDWSLLPPTTPDAIRKLLRRTLEKERKRRLADISDALFELEEGNTGRYAAGATSASHVNGRATRDLFGSSTLWRMLPWFTTAALTAALGWMLVTKPPWRDSTRPSPIRLAANIGVDASLSRGPGSAVALSPDGRTVAFAVQKTPEAPSLLYVRPLDRLEATPLAGTDDASQPFFSPDGQWIAFFAAGKLKKVGVAGGAVLTLADAPSPRGGDWSEDDTIVFLPVVGGGAALLRVPAEGGRTERAIPPDASASQRWPQVLPGKKAVLYTNNSPAEGQRLMVSRLPDGPGKVLEADASYGRYLRDGHVVFLKSATLFAAAFDVDSLEMTGTPVPILEGVANLAQNNGAQFAVSNAGTLIYIPGASQDTDRVPIVWMDTSGKAVPLRETPLNWAAPNFSPDGRKLAIDVLDGGNVDVAVYDLERDTLNKLTTDAAPDASPIWTPDGKRLTYRSLRLAPTFPYNLFWQFADGTGEAERLTENREAQTPGSWHPSGKILAFEQASSNGDSPVMILPFEGSSMTELKAGKPYVFPTGRGNATTPAFSPDGKFLAYTSYASGRAEIHVRPFPGPGGEWVVSSGGGNNSAWSRARQELFYNTLGSDNHIMVVPYRIEGQAFVAEKPRVWSSARFMTRRGRSWALHPDGNRIAMAPAAEMNTIEKQNTFVVVLNFLDEVRRVAVPAKH